MRVDRVLEYVLFHHMNLKWNKINENEIKWPTNRFFSGYNQPCDCLQFPRQCCTKPQWSSSWGCCIGCWYVHVILIDAGHCKIGLLAASLLIWAMSSLMLLFFSLGGSGDAGGDEGDGISPDGGQSGSTGFSSSSGQPVNLRQKLSRAQNRPRLVNKPQDFQVSFLCYTITDNK